MGRDSRGHYIKINSLIPLAKVWLSYRRAYRSTQAPEGGWEVERLGGRGCKQALWHVHTNHPHLDDNDENERERDERKRERKDREERMREETQGGGRGPLVCSRCSRDGIRERGCMLGIRRRGHYKEL